MDVNALWSWISSIVPPLFFLAMLIVSIRAWGWWAGAWVAALGIAGAVATVVVLQQNQSWLFMVVSILGFPLGLIPPLTLNAVLFSGAIWLGEQFGSVVIPLWYGIAFVLCAMLQVFIVRMIAERVRRTRKFRERQQTLGQEGYAGAAATPAEPTQEYVTITFKQDAGVWEIRSTGTAPRFLRLPEFTGIDKPGDAAQADEIVALWGFEPVDAAGWEQADGGYRLAVRRAGTPASAS